MCVIYLIVGENKMKIDISSMRQGSQNYMGEVEHKIMWEKFKAEMFLLLKYPCILYVNITKFKKEIYWSGLPCPLPRLGSSQPRD